MVSFSQLSAVKFLTHRIKTSKTKLIPIAGPSTKSCNQIYSCNSLLLCDRPCDFVAPFCETKIWPGKHISSLFHSCKKLFRKCFSSIWQQNCSLLRGALNSLAKKDCNGQQGTVGQESLWICNWFVCIPLGAVHKLCHLKICDFSPPPPHPVHLFYWVGYI